MGMGHELRGLTKGFETTLQSCVLLGRLGGPIGLSTRRFVGVSQSGQTIGMTVTRRTSGCRSGCAWPAPANHDAVATATRGAAICKSALGVFGRVDILVNSAREYCEKMLSQNGPPHDRLGHRCTSTEPCSSANPSLAEFHVGQKGLRWQPRRLMLTSGQHAGLTVRGALQGGRSRMSFRAATPVAGPPAGGK